MTKQESTAINIARFILVVGIVIYHLPTFNFSVADGVSNLDNAPVYHILSSRFFLTDIPLQCLFFLSGYLFFTTIPRGGYSYEIYVNKINKRIKSLLVPYLFWNIFWLAYNVIKELKMQTGDIGVLDTRSIFDFLALFWEKGFGDNPDFPIAGYAWFIRDLFCFAILTPIYNYIYQNKRLSVLILLGLIMLSLFKDWHQPGINTYLFIGGWFAYNGQNLESLIKKFNWWIVGLSFLAINYIYYVYLHYDCVRFILITICGFSVIKFSYALSNVSWLAKLSITRMYVYVTHIFFINISRHTIIKFMPVTNDFEMCAYFLAYSSVTIILCFGSYYLLKKMNANRLLGIMTGGRN